MYFKYSSPIMETMVGHNLEVAVVAVEVGVFATVERVVMLVFLVLRELVVVVVDLLPCLTLL